ncbi:MAG: GlxA family transcriptional regulator, partial [Myxococcota bacterium]
ALRDRALVDFLRRAAPRARRVASICSGTFLLAEAGLLDGRRATTHWAHCAELAKRYPRVAVETDPIFVRDGKLWSSAGVCAGMDLALALAEQDHGRELALTVAQWMVLFLKRPGGQSQFSVGLAAQATEHERIRELQAWAQAHLPADLGIAALAKRAAMSPRNFARVFAREVGETPARWVERARVEAARRLLEESDDGVDAVASRCGFGTAETLRRAFLRQLRVGPAAYRARFRSAAA